jgi:HIP---CoA ligase
MADLMFGATCIPMTVFAADAVLELIEAERISHISGPPTAFATIVDHERRDAFDLSSLRLAFLAATTIPERLVRRLYHEMHIETVMTGYGLTENHAIGAFTRPDTPLDLVSTTVGQLWPDVEARLVDSAGQPVPDGEPGEILLRGYALMSGYYEDEGASASAVKNGWLHTGDIGSWMTEDIFVSLIARRTCTS